MAGNDSSRDPSPRRDYSGLAFLGVLVVLEIAVLYLLIAVESPLSPTVRLFLRRPFGIFALVLTVATTLGFLMAVTLRAGQAVQGRLRARGRPPTI